MQLRPYQQKGIQLSFEAFDRGVKRQLWSKATGLGKTVAFSALIAARPGRALVLAHRDRLIQQAVDKISGVLPINKLGIVKAEQNRYYADCVIASVQTLARQARLNQLPKFDTVIIDEAHRSAAKIYRRIIEHVCHEDTLLLGVTATPDRADGKGLDGIYEEIVFEMGLLEGIEQGYLCDLKAIQVKIDADFSKVHSKTNTDGINDYKQDEVCELMEAGNWFAHVTNAWQTHASDRRTIVFVPRVAMAYKLAQFMNERGIRAAALDGSTPLVAQRVTVQQFEAGRIQVLINCDLFVEGADIPSINCVVMARPTKSRTVYCQAVGRGTRKSEETGKTDCLVLDVVGVTERLDLCTAACLIGARRLQPCELLTAAKKREKKEQEEREAEQQRMIEEDKAAMEARLRSQEIDLFGRLLTAESFEWEIIPEQRRSVLRTTKARYEILKMDDGHFEYYNASLFGTFQGIAWDYSEARNRCEEHARVMLRGPEPAWKSDPASPRQLSLLDKMRIRYLPGITKSAASNLIAQAFNRRRKAA